jgi:hypothetical protein
MQRVHSFRQGDRSEYLAQYILSALAITVPVPRQEDVGTDFHCSLLRRVGTNLQPYLPFNIQVKSDNPDLRENGIRFGGLTTGGAWRSHEIEGLCQTDTPFLIGVVNKEDQRLDLFSTITRYFVCVNWSGKGSPREVALIPYQPGGEVHLGSGELTDIEEKLDMPNTLWRIPIGQAIVSIPIADSENGDRCEEIKGILEPYLRMDQENAVFARLGLGHFNWPLVIRPGMRPSDVGVGYSFGPPGTPAFNRQSQTLCKIMASILRSFKEANLREEIRPWLPIIERIDLSQLDPITQRVFAEVKAFATD